MLQKLLPAVYPSATATTKDRRLARTKTVCRQRGLTPASHHCSWTHSQHSFISYSTSSEQSIRSATWRLHRTFPLYKHFCTVLQHIVYLCHSAHSWYWQVVSPLREENSSPYFLIIQLLPVPSQAFLSFQDFLSSFNKEQGHYKFFQLDEHFPYVWHFQKPNSLLALPSDRPFLKLNPDYLLTSLHAPSYLVICSMCMGYSLFTLPLLTSAGRTTDVTLSQMSLLSCWLICQWNLQITFRSNTSEHTWQLLFCHWTLLGVFQLDRTDIGCLYAPKESSFSISFIPRQGWATTSELNFLIEHLKNVVWESSFSTFSIANQAKHQTRCGIPYCHRLMYIYTVS